MMHIFTIIIIGRDVWDYNNQQGRVWLSQMQRCFMPHGPRYAALSCSQAKPLIDPAVPQQPLKPPLGTCWTCMTMRPGLGGDQLDLAAGPDCGGAELYLRDASLQYTGRDLLQPVTVSTGSGGKSRVDTYQSFACRISQYSVELCLLTPTAQDSLVSMLSIKRQKQGMSMGVKPTAP